MNGHLILIMAPSGSGKGVLIDHIKEKYPEIHFAVSCTTRDKRPGEVDGDVYHFLSLESFNQKIANEEFLEWAEFSGNRYGTLKSEIITPLQEGKIVLREVELQGIKSIQELIPKENRTVVYIDAGSWEMLKKRILARAPISDEHLELRHQRFIEESKWKEFADVVIRNEEGKLEDAKVQLETIIQQHLDKT